ncbi:MAG: hypothetical protein ABFC80_05090, partial [Coriobacteriales bacterium]
MKLRATWRIWVLTAVVAVATAVFVLMQVQPAATQTDTPPIDLTADVEARNCTPCHPVIGASRKPGIIFNHAAHLMTDCSACHFVNAHESGKTATPAMASCFACHGLTHGPTGVIASGECGDCHTDESKLRPSSHVKDWKTAPHARAAKADVNSCMLCHEARTDCDECHTREWLDLPPMPEMYLRSVPVKQDEPAVLIDVDEPTTISQCTFCHPNINGFADDRIIFTHADHLKREYRCEACHPRFAHQPTGETDHNTMQMCYRCHGLVHSASGEVAPQKCEACHPKDFPLVPADHTTSFKSGGHKDLAHADSSYCSMCHTPDFCVKCHNGGVKLADGRTSNKVIPVDHRKPDWSSKHGALFLEQKGDCAVCHASSSCERCHQTTMPHPTDWLARHTKMNGTLPDDCNVCHKDRETCQECHHQSVRSTQLVLKNCVQCHDEMRTRPATKIKNSG